MALTQRARWGIGISIGLAGSAAALLLRPADITALKALLGLCIVWVGLVPGFIYLLTDAQPPVPIFPAFAAFHAVTFGLPVLLTDVMWPLPPPGEAGTAWLSPHIYRVYVSSRAELFSASALGLSLAGLILTAGSYYAVQYWVRGRVPPFRICADTQRPLLVFLSWALLFGHLAYVGSPALQRMPSAGQLLIPAGYLAFGMFYLLWREKRIGNIQATTVLLLLGLDLFEIARGGLITPLMAYVLFFLFLMIRLRRWWFVALAVVALLLVGSAYQTVSKFRAETFKIESERSMAIGLGERLVLFAGLYAEAIERPRAANGIITSYQTTARRLALISLFSHVTTHTPASVPLWRGETYKPLVTSFVPRIVWKDKPEEKAGRTFGLRYGLIVPEDTQTSVNLPWLIELYANFGEPGVLIGMTLIGIFLAFLDQVFNQSRMQTLDWLIGLTIIFPLSYPESNFSLMCGSLVPLALVLWLLFTVALRLPRIRGN